MTTPAPELLARVGELNDPASPFVFRADGGRIVGSWDIAHVQYVALLGAGQIDEKYRIEVELDAEDGTYDLDEHQTSTRVSGGFSTGGSFHVGGSAGGFRGTQTRRQGGFVAGTNVRTPEGSGTSASWSFDTDRIKQPLEAFLAAHGWKRRKGFLGRLFG
jgi:hypothetical protein